MIKKKYFGKVKDGKFKPDLPQDFKKAFYMLEGLDTEVTVDKKQKIRSNPENRYYRGVVVPLIAETIGEYDEDEVHEMLKIKFLPIEKEGFPNSCKSTTTLTTVEFEEYLSKIRMWASEFLNCYIPLPNEVDY